MTVRYLMKHLSHSSIVPTAMKSFLHQKTGKFCLHPAPQLESVIGFLHFIYNMAVKVLTEIDVSIICQLFSIFNNSIALYTNSDDGVVSMYFKDCYKLFAVSSVKSTVLLYG